jgi:signal-transduction protein with cAMP-binding, CBS, and nucleotidyltransferase domain
MQNEDQALEEFNLKVKDVMTRSPLSLDVMVSVEEAAREMELCDCGCCLVEYKGRIVGIITEKDIVRRIAAKGSSVRNTTVKAIMSSPIIAVEPEATLEDALKTMASNRIKHLVVVDDEGLVGIVSIIDIAKALAVKAGRFSLLFNAILRQNPTPKDIYT